tara:strand:+ start:289 stop:501 length:213 start_codon:yes stop_codon:yes gene_type:complete
MARTMKIEYLKTGRKITHPSGHIVTESLNDIDRRVEVMTAERDYLTGQIDHMASEKAKCLAAASEGAFGG